jgi:hypothetical protein
VKLSDIDSNCALGGVSPAAAAAAAAAALSRASGTENVSSSSKLQRLRSSKSVGDFVGHLFKE